MNLSFRLIAVVCLYLGFVAIAGTAFSFVRLDVAEESPTRYLYTLLGPALSLFTHMSYFLFALQSVLLLPWLLLAAVQVWTWKWATAAFAVCWLGIGWYMHDLF